MEKNINYMAEPTPLTITMRLRTALPRIKLVAVDYKFLKQMNQMKTYKITKHIPVGNIESVEITEEEIRELIKNNPELLTPTPTRKRKYFMPKDESYYYSINDSDEIKKAWFAEGHPKEMHKNIFSGNSFATEQDAQDEVNHRQALVRIWNNYDDKYSWDIDWEDVKQDKYPLAYDYEYNQISKKNGVYNYVKLTTELPYFKSAEDRNQFVEDNRDDLLKIFNIKK